MSSLAPPRPPPPQPASAPPPGTLPTAAPDAPVHASLSARLAAFVVRRVVRPKLADMSDPLRVRKAFGTPLPVPRGVCFTPATLGGVAGEWVSAAEPAPPARSTLLYLHGGGFVACSPRTHRPLTASFALRGFRVFVPDYRLAPEHPFPAATDDVQAVWHALRAQCAAASADGQPGRLVVAGDSAGGNLTLALLLALRDAGAPLPDAAVLFSPSLDMTGSSPSLYSNDGRDAMFPAPQLEHLLHAYLQGADATQPLASPLLGDLRGLPPLLFHVGADEVLRDDSLRAAEKARAAGVPVELQVFERVNHVWQLSPWIPEARRSLDSAARFMHEAQRDAAYVEHKDVLIVGAGLSGIGAAVHLMNKLPGKSLALLEGRERLGGTWDLHRYPGVRSDSDMYTLGYRFKPWRDAKAIAEGATILRYLQDTAAEHGVDRLVRLQHRVLAADWSSRDARWQVTVACGAHGERLRLSCGFLFNCGGYYRYDRAHRPRFAGEEQFAGRIVHPQFWPDDLDWAGKQVLVIGSGATAVTLVPALAASAARVTMLQRSPTYLVERPSRDALAAALNRSLPSRLAYMLVRIKNVLVGSFYFVLARQRPALVKSAVVGRVGETLGPGFDVKRDFTPRYDPWRQRVCLVPDGDLFNALRSGRAAVVTGEVDTFTADGVRLASGQQLAADIVVTATGFELLAGAGIELSVDGRPFDAAQALTYKGVLLSGLPNFANTFGYTHASWTLKSDLTAHWVCRLLRRMERRGQASVVAPTPGAEVARAPLLDFSSGYVARAAGQMPQQGQRWPWRLSQSYLADWWRLRFGRLDDGVLKFDAAPKDAVAQETL